MKPVVPQKPKHQNQMDSIKNLHIMNKNAKILNKTLVL